MKWPDDAADRLIAIARKHDRRDFHRLMAEVRATFGAEVTGAAVRSVMGRAGRKALSSYCADAPPRAEPTVPSEPRALPDLDWGDDEETTPLGTRDTEPAPAEVPCRVHVDREAEPRKLSRQRYAVGIMSDLHAGSEYIRRAALVDFVGHAYERGVRRMLVPGDLLDGYYERHGKFQLSHVGVTAQARDLYETLPRMPGLIYEAETGNHDETYADASGLDVVGYLNAYFRERGREDFRVHGEREVFLSVYGAQFCLWHPRSAFSQAQMRRQMQRFPPGVDPRFLLVGHWHVYDQVRLGKCLAIALPSFQGGGSAFGKSLPGHTTVGGVLLSWEADPSDPNEVHSVGVELREYPERVAPRIISVAS